jgi:hypothetical protein
MAETGIERSTDRCRLYGNHRSVGWLVQFLRTCLELLFRSLGRHIYKVSVASLRRSGSQLTVWNLRSFRYEVRCSRFLGLLAWFLLGLIASILGRRWEVGWLGDDWHYGDIEGVLVELSLADTSSYSLVDRSNKSGNIVVVSWRNRSWRLVGCLLYRSQAGWRRWSVCNKSHRSCLNMFSLYEKEQKIQLNL